MGFLAGGGGGEIMKNLLGILILDRPKTLALCLSNLLQMDDRHKFTIILVDNGSNEETKEVIKKYEKEIDCVITNAWNVGYCFGVNQWLAKRESGQHCVQIDSDCLMKSKDWWQIASKILEDEDIGMIAARRPSAWIDRPDKQDGYKNLYFEKRHDHWLEIPKDNFLIAPILIYKGELLDRMGFENEMTQWGDLESPYRVKALGYKSVYIPDIFLYQLENNWEYDTANLRKAHLAMLNKRQKDHNICIQEYLRGQKIYKGTRWLPETTIDKEYEFQSDINWNFFKDWPNVEKYYAI